MLSPMDRAEREIAYSPSSCVADIEPFLDRYAAESSRVRDTISFQTHHYGSGPRAELDVFPAGPDRVHAFIHGGYWQQLSKDDSSFPAEPFTQAGITYVAVGYDLCPQVSLFEIEAEIVAALQWVQTEFPGASVTLSGSSAGAHLAAFAARTVPVDRLVLLSGIYDLRPLVETYVNDEVGLTHAEAEELSPLLWSPPQVPAEVVWGENETNAFKRQSSLYAEHLGVTPHEIAGRNHFDLVHDLYGISEASS
ncbi:MAG: alpha/beta hydrolase fold domain-containing protein [Acidimicrobiia bacterium]|nr:alpha/beta hydrolase fold domain-containing protein [Acidimicrobiia bacterium]